MIIFLRVSAKKVFFFFSTREFFFGFVFAMSQAKPGISALSQREGRGRGDRTRDPHVVPRGFRMGSAWVPQRVPRGFRRGSAGVPQGVPQGFRRGSVWVPQGVPQGFRMGPAAGSAAGSAASGGETPFSVDQHANVI